MMIRKLPLILFSLSFSLLLTHAAYANADDEKIIVFIGDSLAEGYGVQKGEGFPEVAGRVLNASGKKVKIVNGGIAGSVTADADRRVKWFLKAKPDVIFLALGGNDGLKGTPPNVIEKNLAAAIDVARENKIKVVLAGIKVYTNFGADYAKKFEKVFTDLAKEKKVQLMPFLLEGVALDRTLNQSDMKHPNAKGHEVVGKNVAKELEKAL